MVEEDGKYMVGSFFLVEATREEAQKFVDDDPFNKVFEHRVTSCSARCGHGF